MRVVWEVLHEHDDDGLQCQSQIQTTRNCARVRGACASRATIGSARAVVMRAGRGGAHVRGSVSFRGVRAVLRVACLVFSLISHFLFFFPPCEPRTLLVVLLCSILPLTLISLLPPPPSFLPSVKLYAYGGLSETDIYFIVAHPNLNPSPNPNWSRGMFASSLSLCFPYTCYAYGWVRVERLWPGACAMLRAGVAFGGVRA
jgi:hypothetical protein